MRLVGSSPEVMVRLEEGTVTVRPIAGTRRGERTRRRTGGCRQACWPTPRSAPST